MEFFEEIAHLFDAETASRIMTRMDLIEELEPDNDF